MQHGTPWLNTANAAAAALRGASAATPRTMLGAPGISRTPPPGPCLESRSYALIQQGGGGCHCSTIRASDKDQPQGTTTPCVSPHTPHTPCQFGPAAAPRPSGMTPAAARRGGHAPARPWTWERSCAGRPPAAAHGPQQMGQATMMQARSHAGCAGAGSHPAAFGIAGGYAAPFRSTVTVLVPLRHTLLLILRTPGVFAGGMHEYMRVWP